MYRTKACLFSIEIGDSDVSSRKYLWRSLNPSSMDKEYVRNKGFCINLRSCSYNNVDLHLNYNNTVATTPYKYMYIYNFHVLYVNYLNRT